MLQKWHKALNWMDESVCLSIIEAEGFACVNQSPREFLRDLLMEGELDPEEVLAQYLIDD